MLLPAVPIMAARAAPPAEGEYAALVDRARAGDRTLDLAKLREAAARAGVEPDPGAKDALWKAVKAGDAEAQKRAADAVQKLGK